MASQYYGSKGESTRKMQEELNKLGANLVVDGIWGSKTEAAYNKYMTPQTSNTPSGVTYSQFTPMTDEELNKIAGLANQKSYDLSVEHLNSQYQRNLDDLSYQKERTQQDYNEKAAAISGAFTDKRSQLSDYALSRGIGRSSYALDMQNKAYSDEQAALLGSLNDKQQKLQELDKNISILNDVLAESVDKLSVKRLEEIEGIVEKLKYEQQKTQQDILQYNNSLWLQTENLKLKQQQAKKSTSSSSSSSSSNSNQKYINQVLSDWDKLGTSGKINYFEQNAARIRMANNNLYLELKRQYDAYKSQYKSTPAEQVGTW